ncbi:hypothetical protein BD410DRAFT_789814 [Rickenella mellea]|uniref:Uncharacterized protein n=1 Tax=Rickenella mellea TaxID=50990 RepID=A0A4Y7Q3K7_9AGAM|nr:hypothetical protein BD410DRAFT_789814 [Rickenella mellea]
MDRSTSRRTNSTSSSPPTTTRYHGARYRSPTTPIILPTSPPSALLTPGRLPDVSPPVTRVPVIPDSDHTSSSPSISSNDSYQTNTTSYPTMVPIEPVNHIYVTQPTWVPLPTAPVIPEEVPRQTNTALPQTYGRLVPSGYDPIPLPSEKRLEEISKGPYHLRSRLLTDPTPGAVEHFADGVARFMLRLLFLDIPHVYFKRVFKLAATPQGQSGGRGVVTRTNPVTSPVAPSKDEWTTLVESTIKEWETLNILSGLTFSAVLTMLQFDNVRKGANSYVAAVIALTFAFWACILGCVYIVRFVSMKTPDMEYFWMKEAQEWNVNKYFNMWLLLAMPAVMAAWFV